MKVAREKFNELMNTIKASAKSKDEQALIYAEVIGDVIDPENPLQPILERFCDMKVISKDNDYAYFRISSKRVKATYDITSNGVVVMHKVAKEGLQTLTVSDKSTKVEYMPLVDVMSAKGYDALKTIRQDVHASLDLRELADFFAVLDAAVPAANKFTLADCDTDAVGFDYKVLRKMRSQLKDYASKFELLTGSHIDDEIADWEYDENKYQSIRDMVAKLGVTITYVGEYTLNRSGSDEAVIDPDTAYMIATPAQLDGKPFVFARQEIVSLGIEGIEKDSAKQRVVQMIPTIAEIGNVATAAMGFWGYEKNNIVCRMPLALAKYSRA